MKRALALGFAISTFTASAAMAEDAPEEIAPMPRRIGLVVGEPVGLSLAVPVRGPFSAHATVGFSGSDRFRHLIALDFAYDLPEVFGPVGPGDLVLWFGLGVRYVTGRDAPESDRFGFRLPFGVSWFERSRAFELYLQVAAGVSAIPDPLASVDGGAGIRLAF